MTLIDKNKIITRIIQPNENFDRVDNEMKKSLTILRIHPLTDTESN